MPCRFDLFECSSSSQNNSEKGKVFCHQQSVAVSSVAGEPASFAQLEQQTEDIAPFHEEIHAVCYGRKHILRSEREIESEEQPICVFKYAALTELAKHEEKRRNAGSKATMEGAIIVVDWRNVIRLGKATAIHTVGNEHLYCHHVCIGCAITKSGRYDISAASSR